MYRDKYGEHGYWLMLGCKGLRTATGYEESHESAYLGFLRVFIIKSCRSVPVESVYSNEPSTQTRCRQTFIRPK